MLETIATVLPFLLVPALAVMVLWNLNLQARLNSLSRRLRGVPTGNLDAYEKLAAIEHTVNQLKALCNRVDLQLRKALTRVGLVRFNPFAEMGGAQSFALALLDEDGNGVVVSSLHGRSATRFYVKTVEAGRSSQALSKEEQEAIDRALGKVAGAHEDFPPKGPSQPWPGEP